MTTRKINSAKSIVLQSLTEIPGFNSLSVRDKGIVIDRFAKATFLKLMEIGGMKPGEDYIKDLSDTKECADFIIMSEKANEYTKKALEGNILNDSNECFIQLKIPFDDVA